MSGDLKKATAGRKFLGSILLFLAFALIFGIGALCHHLFPGMQENFDAKRGEARSEKLEALNKENEQKLTTYAWVNKDKQIVQIPIEQAMKLVAAELAVKPVNPSAVKVENPYPYGLQDVPAPAPAVSGTAPATSGSTTPASPAGSGTTTPAPAPPVPAAATPATLH